jgi:hypothetical protein
MMKKGCSFSTLSIVIFILAVPNTANFCPPAD